MAVSAVISVIAGAIVLYAGRNIARPSAHAPQPLEDAAPAPEHESA
jgi:hypothetical protein